MPVMDGYEATKKIREIEKDNNVNEIESSLHSWLIGTSNKNLSSVVFRKWNELFL